MKNSKLMRVSDVFSEDSKVQNDDMSEFIASKAKKVSKTKKLTNQDYSTRFMAAEPTKKPEAPKKTEALKKPEETKKSNQPARGTKTKNAGGKKPVDPSSSLSDGEPDDDTEEHEPEDRIKVVKKLNDEEIDQMLSADFVADRAVAFVEMDHNSHIFRHSSLHRFLATQLAELNPKLSISGNAIEFYHLVFVKFILARVCFAYWDVKRSSEYAHYPEGLKMDKFMENAWKENYEDDVRAKFIYHE